MTARQRMFRRCHKARKACWVADETCGSSLTDVSVEWPHDSSFVYFGCNLIFRLRFENCLLEFAEQFFEKCENEVSEYLLKRFDWELRFVWSDCEYLSVLELMPFRTVPTAHVDTPPSHFLAPLRLAFYNKFAGPIPIAKILKSVVTWLDVFRVYQFRGSYMYISLKYLQWLSTLIGLKAL